ncbi:MAG: hypothetical protein KGI94_00075 [Paracoccaceae bacterium]|nr:hypothetical protein [Paracoccaceae bacterium]MDE3121652.1 hypothetical protein [Paracoccaceae bacterium]
MSLQEAREGAAALVVAAAVALDLAPGAAAAAGPTLGWGAAGQTIMTEMSNGPAFDAIPDAGGGKVTLRPTGVGAGIGLAAGTDSGGYVELDFEGYALSDSRSSDSTSATAAGAFALTSGTVPQGTISIDTTPSTTPPGAQATVSLTAPKAGGGTTTILSYAFSPQTPAGNAVTQVSSSPTADGRAVVAITLRGDTLSSVAYGLIYGTSGVSLTGLGGAAGATQVHTTLTDRVSGTNQSINLGRKIAMGGGWDGSLRAGLGAYRSNRSIEQTVTYSFAAPSPTMPGAPPVTLSHVEGLRSTYVALTVGGGLQRALTDGWALTMSADVGRARMSGRYSQAMIVTADAGQTPATANSSSRSYGSMAWVGRAQVGVSRAIAPGLTVSVGVFASYLSAVPTVVNTSVTATPVSAGATTASLSGSGQQVYSRGVVERAQLTGGVSFGLVYRF